ncbi:MAG TPA: LysM domain-containing protein [Albitalea sp.]|uniref:LysM domain-containing protein n=1 Tax=Piscinibacter sp. TaxID=1903157 RepID=UPI002ED12968
MPNPRVVLLFACASMLAACSQVPTTAPAPGAPGAASPGQAPAPEAPPPATTPSAPASPATQQQAHKIALNAAVLLEGGNEEQAKAELQRALAADPASKLALSLMRQITADPVATLGRESFPYVVRQNDTMSVIAGRFLGDIYLFYILARYNNIAVPKQVAGGQTLRIPGKAPPPSTPREAPPREAPRVEAAAPPVAAPPPPPVVVAPPPPPEPTPGEKALRSAETAEKAGDLDRALAEYRRAAGLDQPIAEAKAEQVKKQLVQRHSLAARTAFARQDLDGAIRGWDRVLAVDPGNDTAKLEKQRALTLKEKVKKL